ncbi:hypothetical protein FA13DRAFT_259868 [Coprinellus micaceus]|uniref:F-box domain-containing protein n=1 Tax=Coprinellus micaceus TaxID=71717 RepID=A0A4Y7TED1_COPMI|nr:hypothetical protein FA13DRAFT_259868 [Coprinellus micaceus]
MAQSMYLFLGESVTSMTVDGAGTSAPPFSASICLYAKHLVHLEKLVYRGTRGGLDDFISASGWKNLQNVEVEEISAESLRRLAHLPNLSSLTVSARGDSHVPDERKYQKAFHRHATIHYGFQSLRRLKIEAAHFEYLRTFLQYLSPYNPIQSIEFLTHLPSPTPEASCQDVLLAVAQYANPKALAYLRVGDATCFKSVPASSRKKVQDLVDISVLYDFKALKALTVHCEAGVRATPEDVSSVAEAWPNIETLDLCTTLSSPLPPYIDHSHLLEILGGCPSLRHLGLRFDAMKLSAYDVGTDAPRPVYAKLRKLSIGESPIDSPGLVMNFIKVYFPNLEALDMCYTRAMPEELETEAEGTEPPEPEVHQFDDMWDGIRESLGLGFDSDRI